jgi:hypothetical protein
MSTSYTTRAAIQKPAALDPAWNLPLNANADALDTIQSIGSLAVSPAERPSASLNVQVAAGVFISSGGVYVTYTGTASFALTASATNYLWLTDAGVLAVSTSAFPAASVKCVRLAAVSAGASSITGIIDARVPFISAG